MCLCMLMEGHVPSYDSTRRSTRMVISQLVEFFPFAWKITQSLSLPLMDRLKKRSLLVYVMLVLGPFTCDSGGHDVLFFFFSNSETSWTTSCTTLPTNHWQCQYYTLPKMRIIQCWSCSLLRMRIALTPHRQTLIFKLTFLFAPPSRRHGMHCKEFKWK